TPLRLLLTCVFFILFFFNSPSTTEIYTLSLHGALPIFELAEHHLNDGGERFVIGALAGHGAVLVADLVPVVVAYLGVVPLIPHRSEEHTSELQSRSDIVCRLLLEKKNNKITSMSQSFTH